MAAAAPTYENYTLLEPVGGQNSIPVSPTGISIYFNNIYSFVLILIAITAVFYLIYGGIVYLTTDIANKQKQGKEIIIRVITGLAFVFCVWVVLNSINPEILKNTLSFGPVIGEVVTGPTNPPGGGTTTPPNTTGDKCTDIPASDLVTVQGSYQLKKDAAAQFNSMYDAAKAAGYTLTLTSAYRSPARQTQIWNSYGCKVVSGSAVCNGGKSVAIPCSLGGPGSNHSTGYAVDVNNGCSNGSTCNTPAYNWLKTNGGRYNFNNSLPTDPVHWSVNGR